MMSVAAPVRQASATSCTGWYLQLVALKYRSNSNAMQDLSAKGKAENDVCTGVSTAGVRDGLHRLIPAINCYKDKYYLKGKGAHSRADNNARVALSCKRLHRPEAAIMPQGASGLVALISKHYPPSPLPKLYPPEVK